MKPSLTPCASDERSWCCLRSAMHGRHVDLVEGGEQRGRLLRLDQPLGDALAERAHRHDALVASPRRARPARACGASAGRERGGLGCLGARRRALRASRSAAARRRPPWRRRGRRGRAPATSPGATPARGRRLARGRRVARRAVVGLPPAASAAGAGAGAFGGRLRPRAAPSIDVADDVADRRPSRPSGFRILREHARGRARELDRRLVGLELDERLVGRDRVASAA